MLILLFLLGVLFGGIIPLIVWKRGYNKFYYIISILLTGIIFSLIYLRFGLTINMFINLILVLFLIIATHIDFKKRIIPNSLVLIGVITVFVFHILSKNNLSFYLLSVLLAVLTLIIIYYLSGRKLGGGDIKIYLLIALSVGYINTVISMFFSTLISLIIVAPRIIRHNRYEGLEVPYMPFILQGVLMLYIVEIIVIK